MKTSTKVLGGLGVLVLAGVNLFNAANVLLSTRKTYSPPNCETYQGYNLIKEEGKIIGVFDESPLPRKGDPNYWTLLTEKQREDLEIGKLYRLQLKGEGPLPELVSAEPCREPETPGTNQQNGGLESKTSTE